MSESKEIKKRKEHPEGDGEDGRAQKHAKTEMLHLRVGGVPEHVRARVILLASCLSPPVCCA